MFTLIFLKYHLVLDKGPYCRLFLFALYVNDIVNDRNCTSSAEIILYADDILLISSSVSKLQEMLNRCEQELDWLDMSINESKSYCVRIGNRFNAKCASITTSSGHELAWVNEIRYLGVYIVSSRQFKCSYKQAKSSFYRAANAVFSKIGRTASEEVFLHLVFSKCVPILIYGLECFKLTKSDEKAIDFPFIRLLMKLFKTTDITVINECRVYLGIDLPSVLIKKRSVKLARKHACKTNSFYRYLHVHANCTK